MEHVEVLQRMANESWRGSPEHAALTAAIAALSAPQPPAEAQPVDRARTLDAARFRAACYARLKDTAEWAAFYVAAKRALAQQPAADDSEQFQRGWQAGMLAGRDSVQPAAVDEATRRDAERYRWLRAIPESVRADHERNPANGGWDAPFYWPGSAAGEELQGRDLDAAIDAAVQQEACHA